jgi:micrococcal nuclease
MVENKTVMLYKDVSETDRYGRLLRFVIVDNIFVNYELVRLGYAEVTTYAPDVACEQNYFAAQNVARANVMGLWQQQALATSTLAVSSNTGNCDPAYPTVCIPRPPPDLDCKDVPYKRFQVLAPDPHRFDGDGDGIGCER